MGRALEKKVDSEVEIGGWSRELPLLACNRFHVAFARHSGTQSLIASPLAITVASSTGTFCHGLAPLYCCVKDVLYGTAGLQEHLISGQISLFSLATRGCSTLRQDNSICTLQAAGTSGTVLNAYFSLAQLAQLYFILTKIWIEDLKERILKLCPQSVAGARSL